MQRRSLYFSVAIMLLFSNVGFCARPADWMPDEKLTHLLGDRHIEHGLSIRPPRYFHEIRHPNAAAYKSAEIEVLLWQKETQSPFSPTLLLMSFPPLDDGKKSDSREVVEGFVDSQKARWANVEFSPQFVGRIHGIPARRLSFTATADDGTRIAGFLVVLIDAHGTVQLHGLIPGGSEDPDFKMLECAAMTFNRQH